MYTMQYTRAGGRPNIETTLNLTLFYCIPSRVLFILFFSSTGYAHFSSRSKYYAKICNIQHSSSRCAFTTRHNKYMCIYSCITSQRVIIHHSKNNVQSLINLVQLFCPTRCGRQHFLYEARKRKFTFCNITMTRISTYIRFLYR